MSSFSSGRLLYKGMPARGPFFPTRMAGESFAEVLTRRGLINNLVTAGFIGLGLFVLLSPNAATSASVSSDKGGYADPLLATVTDKVYFDISIDGDESERIVIGVFGDGSFSLFPRVEVSLPGAI
jgi:hypothetical protein